MNDAATQCLTLVRLEMLENTVGQLGARLAALEGVLFSLGTERELQDRPGTSGDIPFRFRVIGIRDNGEISVVSDDIDFERAKRLRAKLLATSRFARVLVDLEEPHAARTFDSHCTETFAS